METKANFIVSEIDAVIPVAMTSRPALRSASTR